MTRKKMNKQSERGGVPDLTEFSNQILQGDVLEKIKEIPNNSVHCIVTSPPYID